MDGWLASITEWLVSLVRKAFEGLLDFVHDGCLWVFSGVLNAVVAVAGAIPVPDFLQQGLDLGALFGGLPPFAFYLFSKMQLGAGIAMILSGISFNLLRKLFTLGQW